MESPILEKLRKLLAHERSARNVGSVSEAESFAEKIQELLTKYKLDMTDVELDAREEGESIDWDVASPSQAGHSDVAHVVVWQYAIASGIAKCNGCVAVATKGNSIKFTGRTSDRELCKMFFLYMLELARDLVNAALEDARSERFIDAKDFKRSWYSGFGMVLESRLEEKYNVMVAEASPTSNAMVHIKRDALKVQEFLKEKGVRDQTASNKRGRDTSAYLAGSKAGQRVALTPNRLPAASGRLLGGGND